MMNSKDEQPVRMSFIILTVLALVWVLSVIIIHPKFPDLLPQKLPEPEIQGAEMLSVVSLIIKEVDQSEEEEDEEDEDEEDEEPETKMSAVFVVSIGNEELHDWLDSMRELEDRFNRNYQYPYVFLNHEDFSDEFKDKVKSHTKAEVKFGQIPNEHWGALEGIERNSGQGEGEHSTYIRSDILLQDQMSRFHAGFFFRHPMLESYEYYWRVEPNAQFPCDISFDPFKYLHDNRKKYGFTMSSKDDLASIPTLWKTIYQYIVERDVNHLLPDHNARRFLREKTGDDYNGCHFWTTSELGAFSVWRDQKYLDFFDYLDGTGGFFHEHWSDAHLHSTYLSLFLNKTDIHFFDEIGYKHNYQTHCPNGHNYLKYNCHCNPSDNFDFQDRSCSREWKAAIEA